MRILTISAVLYLSFEIRIVTEWNVKEWNT